MSCSSISGILKVFSNTGVINPPTTTSSIQPFVLKLQSAAIWVFMFVWVHFAGAGLDALLLLEQM